MTAGPALTLEVPEPRAHDRLPALAGRRVVLRPLAPNDYDVLFNIAMCPENIWTWRQRGRTPRPEEFIAGLWSDVLAAFAIVSRKTGQTVGLVTAFNADLHSGTAHLGLLLAPDAQDEGWPIDAAILFVNYLFSTWKLRKLYLETVEGNFARLRSGVGRWFEVEGCLRDHDFIDGRYWHFYVTAVYRETFEPRWERFAPHLLDSPDDPES